MTAKTDGEALFERYLISQGLAFEYEKEIPGTTKRPDYTVLFDGQELIFEVKDIVKPPPTSGMFINDPYGPIRSEIDEARKQLRGHKAYPCGLVIHQVAGLVPVDRPLTVFGAMHGNVQIQIPYDPRKGSLVTAEQRMVFGPGGKMTRPQRATPQNRTISALIVVREVPIGQTRLRSHVAQFPVGTWIEHSEDDVGYDIQEIGVGVITYENKDARRPLPAGVFRGPFDQRWAATDEGLEPVFEGERIVLFNKLRGEK